MELALPSQQQVLELLKSSLLSSHYSDLSVVCAGNTHRVHEVIVCGRSEFFARAIHFGGQESHTGIIDLSENKPEVIALLIHDMYEGKYDPTLPSTTKQAVAPVLTTPVKRGKAVQKQELYTYSFPHTCSRQRHSCLDDCVCPHHQCGFHCGYICREHTCETCGIPPLEGSASQLLTHTKMYEVAKKYEVKGLKDLAKEKFSRSCRHFWNTCNFPVAANHAFSTTPESDNGLRDLVSQTIATHMQLTRKPEVRALLMQFDGLALGILDAKSEELGWVAADTVEGV